MGAKLTLARCYEGAGMLASAWTLYSVVQSAAHEQARVKLAGERAAALRPKLAEMTIQVPEAVRASPGLEIRRDGIVVGAAQWGVAIPVDKGVYTLSATAPGKPRWERTVRVEENGAKVEVVIGPLEAEKTQEKAPAPKAAAPAAARRTPPVTRPAVSKGKAPLPLPAQDAGSGRRVAGFVVGGVGIAGLAVGGIAGRLALGKKGIVDENCQDLRCNEEGLAALDSGKTLATVSTVGFAVGLAGLATGVVLVLSAPSGNAGESGKAQVRAGVLGAGTNGPLLGLEGAF
jgi:hypothetical protein